MSPPADGTTPQQNPSGSGSTNTDQKPACDNPATACFVCYLRLLVEETPETKGATFATAELAYNIVGIRRRDSISDRFDDFMAVFVKLASKTQVPAIDKVIEEDLKKNWSECFGKAKSRFRRAPCTKDKAVYAVGLFPEVSTDPGLTDDDAERWQHQAGKLKVKIAETDGAQKKLHSEVDTAKKELADGDAKLNAMPDDPSVKKGNLKKGPKGELLKKLTVLRQANGEKEKKLKKFGEAKKAAEDDLKKAEEALEAAKKKRAPIAILGDGEEGGIAVGRAQMACGVFTGLYALGVHHGSSYRTIHKGHPAFVATREVENCYRFYSQEFLASDDGQKVLKHIDEVGELIPKGADHARKFAAGIAKIVSTPTSPRKLEIQVGAEKISVRAGDVVALHTTAGGTNLHRGHNAKYDAAQDRVVPGRAGGDRVKSFSEGCQVYHDFDAFNTFLRLGEIAKRFTCSSAGGDKKRSCLRLARGGSYDVLSSGEKALERGHGEPFWRSTAAYQIAEERGDKTKRRDELAKKKKTWTPEKAKELEAGRKKPDDKAVAKLTPQEWTSADETELADLEKSIAGLMSQEELAALENQRDAEQRELEKAEKALAYLKQQNIKAKHPKSDDNLEKANPKMFEAPGKAREKLEATKKRLDQKKKDKAAFDKRYVDVLRERCGFFGAEFLRECDVSFECPTRFTYVLVEIDGASADGLVNRFQAKPNVEWDGGLVVA